MEIFFKLIIAPLLTILVIVIIGSIFGPNGVALAGLSSPVIWLTIIHLYEKWDDAKDEQERRDKRQKEKQRARPSLIM